MSTRVWKLAALTLSLAIVPTVARAQAMHSVCKDGTKSVTAGKGTCSGHNGVDAAATKTFLASGKTIMCTDGTMSAGGRGACSGHGGIGKAAEKSTAKAEKKEATAADKKATKPAKKDAKAPA
jgi:hypothetical protein